MAPQKSDPLPTAKDYGETMNKMNMLLAKHSAAMSAFKRSKPATATTTSDSKSASKSNNANANAKKSGFSSLSAKSSAASSAISDLTTNSHATPRQNDSDNDDFGSLNAGVGYIPAGKEAADADRSAETRDLRGKLLGKRAREQREDAAAKKRRAMREESSDEEQGRSKIGKARKGKGKVNEENEDE